MKPTSMRTLWAIWLPLGLSAAIFLGVTFVGNVLVIGVKLGTVHQFLEWAFYVVLGAVFIWLGANPLLSVLFSPVMALEDLANGSSKVDYKTMKKVASQLVNSGVLPTEHQNRLAGAVGLGSDLRKPLSEAVNVQIESSMKIIHEHAVLVFVSTSVSQNGRLDAIAVLATNFSLVRTLVRHFGYRPPLTALINIYSKICLAALVADELDDLDVEGVLGQLGFGAVTAIPGAALVVSSVLDGTFNSLLTLRVGFITRKYLLNVGADLKRTEIRKAANREARQELKLVIKDAVSVLPAAVKNVVQVNLLA